MRANKKEYSKHLSDLIAIPTMALAVGFVVFKKRFRMTMSIEK